MREHSLCDRIIKLDRSIRFVGIVNNRGEVIEGGFKQGVEPLLNGTDEQQMYIHSLSNLTMLQSYSDRLGRVRYSLTEHEKVTLMTFPLEDGILCLSAMPKANMNKIRDKAMKVLKSKSSTGSGSTISNNPARKKQERIKQKI
ncbi:MAG TPA: DUF6659 family protein [Nitrososphaera sp.]|jgi:hypothetical protein|nr:DUF6659 family protein [Nitrososphaera sp.]